MINSNKQRMKLKKRNFHSVVKDQNSLIGKNKTPLKVKKYAWRFKQEFQPTKKFQKIPKKEKRNKTISSPNNPLEEKQAGELT